MPDISWQRNTFHKFHARMKIRVGASPAPIEIHQDDEFEFDGTVLKYGGGEYPSPQTRGAVKMGWAVIAGDTDTPIQTKSSSRSVAKATSVNRDLSKVQRDAPAPIPTDIADEETVMDVSDRRPQNTGKKTLNVPGDKASPKVLTHGMPMTRDEMDGQEGVPVGRVRTAATAKTDVLSTEAVEEARRLSGLSGSGYIPQGSDKPRGHNVIEREGVTVKTNLSAGRITNVESSQGDEGTVVGKVRKTKDHSVEGILVKDTSSIREERAQASVQKPASKAVHVPPKAAPKTDNGIAAKLKTARGIDPKFPVDWNFFAKLSDRQAMIKKMSANRKFLRALYVVEGDSIRRYLEEKFPKLFVD